MKQIKDPDLYRELEKIYNYPLLPVKISKIEKREEIVNMVDISTQQGNFIAQGLLVHNSSQRFARLREGAAKEFYKRIAEVAQEKFLGNPDLKGIIVGGPGPTKEEFLLYLNQELKNKVIGVKDITYTDESGLHELVDKSQDVLAKEEIIEEKKILSEFFTKLVKEPDKVTYGQKEVDKALEMGAVDKLLISEGLDELEIERLQEKAEALGTEVIIISTDTREGVQLRDFGGLVAILRYSLS
jgi:peptide chain release factor subunit 1